MTYDIQMTPESKNDLHSIFEYIAFELQAFQNAAGQLNRLEKSIAGLNQMPERFRLYEKEPWRSRNLRVMPVDNYLVFYIPDQTEKIVTVIRIIYDGRDMDKQLNRKYPH